MNEIKCEYNLNEANRKDIHQIDIIHEINQNPLFIQKILVIRYLNFSFKQLMQLTQPKHQKEIKNINLPKNFINLLSIISNDETFINIYPFCIDPDHFPLQKEQFKQFHETIKLVYVSNYAEKISEDLQILFIDTLEQIFQNPNLFCPDIFWVFIFKWSPNVINEAIKTLDINGFPKKYLYDLFQNFSIPSTILNRFQMSELKEIKNDDNRFYIFNILIENYVKTKRFDLVQNVDISNLNNNEMEYFTRKCYNHMTKNQIDLIDISHLTNETVLLFIQNNIKKISQKHIDQINCAESEIAQIIIDSNHLQNLNKNQIQSINLSEINENLLQKLMKNLNDQNHFDFLSPEQIKGIEIRHIDINAQNNFIEVAANFLQDEEIQKINFDSFQDNQNTIKSILQTLNKFHKLEILKIDQIEQINIFLLNDDELINSMFNIKLFVNAFTHLNCESINDKTVPLINFGNVDIGFLNYFINARMNELSNEQIQQINLNHLEIDVIEKLLIEKVDVLTNESIQLINCEYLNKDMINLIVNKKYDIISKNQIDNININLLTIENQLNLLKFRLDDLNENQIQSFDTSNIKIAKSCLDKRFDLLTPKQINSIDISNLQMNEIEKVLNSKNKFFNDLQMNLIQMVDLTKIKEFNYNLYFDLVMLKPTYLSNEQFITIDWYEENYKFSIIARIFMKKIGMSIEFEDILTGNGEITEEKLKQMPNYFKVAVINSRFLHNIYDFIPIESRVHYLQAVKIMFKLSDKFIQCVEYIINNWSIESRDSIASIITELKIIKFSNETINSLLKYYLLELSEKQIQSLNIKNVQHEIIEKSLLNRANCFIESQFSNHTFPKSDTIGLQLHLLTDESIPHIYIKDITDILLNFIINKKLNLLEKNQIQDIKMSDLKKICLNKLIIERVGDLNSNQIQSFSISELNQNQLNCLLTYRAESMTQDQIESINLGELSNDALSGLIQQNQNKIPLKNIELQIKSQQLNNLTPTILYNFLLAHINTLTVNQIQGIDVSSPLIAARLINIRIKDLSKDQIQRIDWSDNSPIKNRFKERNNESFAIMNFLAKAGRIKDLSKEQFDNSINYERFINIMEIMNENLLCNITMQNVEKINLADFEKNAKKSNFYKLLDSLMTKFSDDQIHILNTEDYKIVRIILDFNVEIKLTIDQIQKIDMNKIENNELDQLILSRSKDFSKKQVQSMELPMNENALRSLLENHIKILTINQIQLIYPYRKSINEILINNRIHDLTSKQINNIFRINELTGRSCEILREAHRFKDLDKYNLNKIPLNSANVIEILHENLLDEIKGHNLNINFEEIHAKANYDDYLKIINHFIDKVSRECFWKIDTSDYNVAKIIYQRNLISKLNVNQKNKFNIELFLKFDDLQLTKFSYSYSQNNKYDFVVKGIILFKYLKYKITKGPIVNYIKDMIRFHYCDIALASFIIFTSELFQSDNFSFESVSKDFFDEFKEMDIFKTSLLSYCIDSYNITPKMFKYFINQKIKQSIGAKMTNTFINSKSINYTDLSQEYKNVLLEINV